MSDEIKIPKICHGCKKLTQIDHYGERFDGDWCDSSYLDRRDEYFATTNHLCLNHPLFIAPESKFEPIGSEENKKLHDTCKKLTRDRDEFRADAKKWEEKFEALKKVME
jgi:hypothetical protein